MKFGELIGRVSAAVRAQYGRTEDVVFSVKGMTNAELIKITQDGPEVIETMKPILLEFEHFMFKRIFYKPDMKPGDVHEIMSRHMDLAMEAAKAEMSARQREKGTKKLNPQQNGN